LERDNPQLQTAPGDQASEQPAKSPNGLTSNALLDGDGPSDSPCTGKTLREALFASSRWLEQHTDVINALNVFPVPDGDTGTNMTATMAAAVAASLPTVQAASTPVVPVQATLPPSWNKRVDAEADIPITTVQIDGLVTTKIIKHSLDSSASAHGLVLGLDLDGVLEISNCFPLPNQSPDEDEKSVKSVVRYQSQMLRSLNEVGSVDGVVGFYQSAKLGAFFKQSLVEAQAVHQEKNSPWRRRDRPRYDGNIPRKRILPCIPFNKTVPRGSPQTQLQFRKFGQSTPYVLEHLGGNTSKNSHQSVTQFCPGNID